MSRLRGKAKHSPTPTGQLTLEGNCFLFDETGYGKGYWAFRDGVGRPGEYHILEEGDHLTIFTHAGCGPLKIIWEGTIVLLQPSELADTLYEINADQHGVDPVKWLHWFLNGHPAELTATVTEDTGKWL